MMDSPAPGPSICPCGRPYALLASVEGRADETLRLPGREGRPVAVHPVVFHRLLEAVSGRGWQVVLEPSRIRIDVLSESAVDADGLAASVRLELVRTGVVPPPIAVQRVASIARGATGKAPLARVDR